jgi:mono/diheme cytochrome c family protein
LSPDPLSRRRWTGLLCCLLLSTGCELRQAMYDQQKYEPLEASRFFADGLSARPPVPGTVARGQLRADEHRYQGRVAGQPAHELPMPLTAALLARGRERYEIFCSPCHDRSGYGNGMIVQRGFKRPPSFHQDRLRQAPVGYLFDVMTNGFGAMASYASRVPVDDRWAIAAYLRALQLSQHAPYDLLPADDQRQLQSVSR